MRGERREREWRQLTGLQEGADNETDEAKEKAKTAIENAKKALEVELKE